MNAQLAIALHIMGFLTTSAGKTLTSEILGKSYGTSPVVLRRVLAKLRRAGLVETRRGVGGGTVLARDPSTINLLEVYQAVAEVEEIQILQRPSTDCGGVIAPIVGTYIEELFSEAEHALFERLRRVSVEDMDSVLSKRIRAAMRNR
ncbi:MAG: Rrf2 family transcriptional regulator [Myxococcota bacterium]